MSTTPARVPAVALFQELARKFSWKIIVCAVISVAAGLFSTTVAIFISRFVVAPDSSGRAVLWFASLLGATFLSRTLATHLVIGLATSAKHELRTALVRRIVATPLRDIERLGPSKLHAVLTDDVGALGSAVQLMPLVVADVSFMLSCLVYLAWLSVSALGVLATFVVAVVALALAIVRRSTRLMTKARAQLDVVYEHFRAATDGVRELQSHQGRRRVFLDDSMEGAAAAYASHFKGAFGLLATLEVLAEAAGWAAIGLVMFAGVLWLGLSGDVLAAFVLGATFMMSPIVGLMNALPRVLSARTALAAIGQLEAELPAAARPAVPPPVMGAPVTAPTIEFSEVMHVYEGSDARFSLGPVDLTLQPGQIVFIVGGNGSGKSTLAKLITGHYTPSGGEITLDGRAVKNESRGWYREHFSAVHGDYFPFLDLRGLSDEPLATRAALALDAVGLAHKVQVRDSAFVVDGLSQGQRARLALAIAILEDRPCLVFDEVAAHQDAGFKRLFYRTILPDLKRSGKLVIAIVHDDEYFDVADHVIKMRDGRTVTEETRQFVRSLLKSVPPPRPPA